MSFSNTRSYNPQTWIQRETLKQKSTPTLPISSHTSPTPSAQRAAQRAAVPTPPPTEKSISASAKPSKSAVASTSRNSTIPSPTKPPTYPNTSAKRTGSDGILPRQKRQRTVGLATPQHVPRGRSLRSKTPAQGRSCNVCGTDVEKKERHRCQTCPELYFCEECIINASALHPQHAFVQQSDANETTADLPLPQPQITPPRVYHCTFCPATIVDIRFECQDCPTILCPQHSTFHTKGHRVLAIMNGVGAKVGGEYDEESSLGSFSGAALPTVSAEARDESNVEGADGHASDDEQGSDAGDEGVSRVSIGSLGRAEDGDGSDDENRDDPGADTDDENGGDVGGDTYITDDYVDDEEDHTESEASPVLQTTISVTFSHQKPLQNEGALKHDIHLALRSIIQGVASGRSQSLDFAPRRSRNSVLDFDIDLACQDPRTPGSRRAHTVRVWSDKDRQKLKKLMARGLPTQEVAAELGRTPSAVSQQWRKQKLQESASERAPRRAHLDETVNITTSHIRLQTARQGSPSRGRSTGSPITRSVTGDDESLDSL